ncbi:transcription factor bHLH168-like [Carica papaya]|uniref:transcription factor bHLH168-like n=1 Tax=Carica papaya TaxID=3649 RepID=UPI000B8D09AD|nr:transcription factor bHLH168-like [Carica papaya]
MERASSSRQHRNIQERNRRLRMRELCSTLVSLLPPQPTRVTVYELIGEAANYINQLKERIKAANDERNQVLKLLGGGNGDRTGEEIRAVVKLTSRNQCSLEVNIISGTNKTFMLHEVISILQEEGAQVSNIALHNIVGHRTIYVIHSQAINSRIGLETSRIEERLLDLLC